MSEKHILNVLLAHLKCAKMCRGPFKMYQAPFRWSTKIMIVAKNWISS